jgi:hypothetical protein
LRVFEPFDAHERLVPFDQPFKFMFSFLSEQGTASSSKATLTDARSYRIESSDDGAAWHQVSILPGTDGLLMFTLPSLEAGITPKKPT